MKTYEESEKELINTLSEKSWGVPVSKSVREKGNLLDIEIECMRFGFINGWSRSEEACWEQFIRLYTYITHENPEETDDKEYTKCHDRMEYFVNKLINKIGNKNGN